MKNYFKILLGVYGFFLVSCAEEPINDVEISEKTNAVNQLEQEVKAFHNVPFKSSVEFAAYTNAMVEILEMAKDPDFRMEVYNQTILQESGEFDMKIATVNEKRFNRSKKSQTVLRNSINDLKQLGQEPVVYYPRASKMFREKEEYSSMTKNANSEPIAVFKNVYDKNYNSPGYILDENGNLEYSHMVSETEALNSDVYVIGNSEPNTANTVITTDPGDGSGCTECGGGSGSGSGLEDRTEGRAEYGGKIQVIDMNEIEHWTAGKFEFRIIVVNSNGTIIKDKEFPKRARSNFENEAWYDFNEFLFNWNTSNIGNFTVEKWIEVDDGGTGVQYTMSIPPAFEGGPTQTVQYTSTDNDEDCGLSIVQFSDKVGLSYGISWMNFKRQ